MKRFWKKPVVKISAVVIIVVGFALLGLWLWSLKLPPEITFDFLNGHDLTTRIEREYDKYPFKVISRYYSFEADFNDVCKAADVKLSGMGFQMSTYAQGAGERTYVRGRVFSNDWRGVKIFDRHKSRVSSPQKSTQNSSAARYRFDLCDGWVTVEVRQLRFRSWPPQLLLRRLIVRLQSVSRQKP